MDADGRGAGRKRQAATPAQPQPQPQLSQAQAEAPPLVVARKKPRRREAERESEFVSVEVGMRELRRRLAASSRSASTGKKEAAAAGGEAKEEGAVEKVAPTRAKAQRKTPPKKTAARAEAAKKPTLAQVRAQMQREQEARVESRVRELHDAKADRTSETSGNAAAGSIASTKDEIAVGAAQESRSTKASLFSPDSPRHNEQDQVVLEAFAAPTPVAQPIETHEFIEDDLDEDLFFLQALEEVEKKLVTPTKPQLNAGPTPRQAEGVKVETPQQHLPDQPTAPQASPPILSPDDVMREFERLRRENEELRKSNERLQAVAASRQQAPSSMANKEVNRVSREAPSGPLSPIPDPNEEQRPTRRVLDLGAGDMMHSPVSEKTAYPATDEPHNQVQLEAAQSLPQSVVVEETREELSKSPLKVAESQTCQQPAKLQSPRTQPTQEVEVTPMLDLSAVSTLSSSLVEMAASTPLASVQREHIQTSTEPGPHEIDKNEASDTRTSDDDEARGDNMAHSHQTSDSSDMSDDEEHDHKVVNGRPVTIDCGNYNEYKQHDLEDENEEEVDNNVENKKNESSSTNGKQEVPVDMTVSTPSPAKNDIIHIDSDGEGEEGDTSKVQSLAGNEEEEDEGELEHLVPAKRVKRPVTIESSSSDSSEASSSESDNEGEVNDTSTKNALEAALQAAATSSIGERKRFAPRAPPPRASHSPGVSAALSSKVAAKRLSTSSGPPQTSSKKRARSDSTLGSSSAMNSKTKSSSSSKASIRSTLLWPALDDFYDFLLDLIPGQVGGGGGQRNDWSSSSSSLRQFAGKKLPSRYDTIDQYRTTQLDAITEELLASIGNNIHSKGGGAPGRLYYLTSISPCGSSQKSNRQKTTLTSSAQIFSESGFTGMSSNANDFILTFRPLRKHSDGVKRPNNGGSASMELLSGDLIVVQSPQWKSFELSAYGVVLCNSVVGDTGGGHGANSGSTGGDTNDQVCVLLRVHNRGLDAQTDDDAVLSSFSAVTELSMSNQRVSKWSWSIQHVHNTTTSAREYQAIKAMGFFSPDLQRMLLNGVVASSTKAETEDSESISDDIMSPELKKNLERKYNSSQMHAIAACLGENKTVMIQGPPGTGKTKTVLGLLSALLDGAGLSTLRKGTARIRVGASLQSGGSSKGSADSGPRNNSVRILVAAPSNAAVDELVVRVVSEGLVDSSTGKPYRPRMVRVGRPESTSAGNTNLHIGSEREASGAKKTRSKMRKYAAEVENLLLETQVARQKASFGTSRAARQAIVSGAQIVFCTLSGAGSVALCDFAHEFDALIIDEAAQAVEASALIPFKFRPHRMILVGDHRQLPATVLSKRLVAIGYDRSLFQRMVENGSRVQMLTRQYRMHPDIARFPSSYFYAGKLVQDAQIARSTSRQFHSHKLFRPFAFIDVASGAQSQVSGSTSLRNMSEVELVAVLIRALLREFPHLEWKKTIGVIAPYKQQIYELGSRLARLERELDVRLGVEVNTVDGFQGREKDIIIYSCVRTSSGGRRGNGKKKRGKDGTTEAFWADERRMNVAITRAKSSLWVLGNSRLLEQSAAWRALIKDARNRRSYFSDAAAKQLLLPSGEASDECSH